jgi:hypothetical protein
MSIFSDFMDAVREAFGGGSSSQSDNDSGSDRTSPRTRPQQRPSIMTVQRTPEDERQRVATRNMPRFGITEGQRTSDPEFGSFSLQGLTSTDPANVMRNIQGAERMARMDTGGGGEDRQPEVAKGERPAEAAAPEMDVGEAKGERPTEEGTGESAAARARRLGLASTIATSPGGLLAGGEGTTRRRRSLMGGGLIA